MDWYLNVSSKEKMLQIRGIVLFLVISIILQVSGERAKDAMYYKFDGVASCFLRLNGTHQFGCTSSHRGNVGVVHVIEKEDDLSWLVDHGQAAPYMAVLAPSMFTRKVLLNLKASGKVNGIFITHDPSKAIPSVFSHEDTCPNRYSGLSSLETQSCGANPDYPVWNPNGTSLLFEDWGMPIFYTNNATYVDEIVKCAKNINTKYAPEDQPQNILCALEMNSHMFAAVNSQKCTQRRTDVGFTQVVFCDPMGGQNIWHTLFPRSTGLNHTEDNRSIFVVAARMDSTSLFDGFVPGAVSPVTGIVTLLTTAALMHKMIPDKTTVPDKNVLFMLFDGESYDYIGSSRVVYDMQRGVFPVEQLNDASVTQPPALRLEHIGLFLELGHLAKPNSQLYAHLNKPSQQSFQTQMIELLQQEGARAGVNITKLPQTSHRLPPASVQSFIKADSDIPAIILTDFSESFSYGYYHSIFDDAGALRYKYANRSEVPLDSIQRHIANVSTTLAHALYLAVMNHNYTGPETVEIDLVDELLHCYLETANCTIFNAGMGQEVGMNKPASLYVSVYTGPSAATLMTGATLAMLTGTPTTIEKAQCQSNKTTDQAQVVNSIPYKNDIYGTAKTGSFALTTFEYSTRRVSLKRYRESHQLNFTTNMVYKYVWVNPDWRSPNHSSVCIRSAMNFSIALSPAFEIEDYNMSSGKYSSWTESRWQEVSVRMFLKPPRSHDVMVLAIGSCVMVLSFAIVFFVKSRAEVLFNSGASVP